MKAVFRAILLDPEARADNSASTSFGKVREPILRLSHFLRAFKASSVSGDFTGLDNTDDTTNSLGQTAMRSPTVFNFYRPGYTPPNSAAAAAGLVAPELALANEVSVAGYLNFLRGTVRRRGAADRDGQRRSRARPAADFSAELALADKPPSWSTGSTAADVGSMPDALKTQIRTAVGEHHDPGANSRAATRRRSTPPSETGSSSPSC